MTYGWAILIIVIVAAVLYSMGIFNPSSSSGTTATGFSPFVVLAQTCGPSGTALKIQFGNNAGVPVTITGASIGTQTGLTGTSLTASPVSPASVANGGSFFVNGTSGTNAYCTAGARYSATITISYTETNSLGTQTLQATGTVAGSAS